MPSSVDPPTGQKPVEWVGSSRDDLKAFPSEVVGEVGHALFQAQIGRKHASAKPLTGDGAFMGAGVLEIVENHDGNTYRAVYTVRFAGVVYVLHAFHKKSKRGVATPRTDIDLVKQRPRAAKVHYEANYAGGARSTG